MKLDAVIVADAAANSSGKLSILGAWITRLSPKQFPWSEPITVVVRALREEGDEESEHTVSINFRGPIAMGFPSEFRVTPDQLGALSRELVDGEEAAVTFVSSIHGLQFSEPGVLEIDVSIDGELVRTCSIVIAGATISPPQ